jgi:hypothetical protein
MANEDYKNENYEKALLATYEALDKFMMTEAG